LSNLFAGAVVVFADFYKSESSNILFEICKAPTRVIAVSSAMHMLHFSSMQLCTCLCLPHYMYCLHVAKPADALSCLSTL